jgi:hypothetical protein
MIAAVPDCLIDGHEDLIETLELPDLTIGTSWPRPSELAPGPP